MPSYAYFQKKIVPLEQANIGIMTHFIHYGTGVFEGIRGNWNAGQKQTYIFRMKEHYERLANGCKVLKINLPISVDEMCRKTVELVAKCGFQEDLYIRPLAYSSSQQLGVKLHNLEHDLVYVNGMRIHGVVENFPHLGCAQGRVFGNGIHPHQGHAHRHQRVGQIFCAQ